VQRGRSGGLARTSENSNLLGSRVNRPRWEPSAPGRAGAVPVGGGGGGYLVDADTLLLQALLTASFLDRAPTFW
jgi:hypothetical protein